MSFSYSLFFQGDEETRQNGVRLWKERAYLWVEKSENHFDFANTSLIFCCGGNRALEGFFHNAHITIILRVSVWWYVWTRRKDNKADVLLIGDHNFCSIVCVYHTRSLGWRGETCEKKEILRNHFTNFFCFFCLIHIFLLPSHSFLLWYVRG